MKERFMSVAWGVAYALALVLALALIASFVVSVGMTLSNYEQAKKVRTYEEEYLPGQSLDAVRVNAPTFSDCKYAYKSCDRTSGASGWYVRIEGQWVYMPVTLGNQQLIGGNQ